MLLSVSTLNVPIASLVPIPFQTQIDHLLTPPIASVFACILFVSILIMTFDAWVRRLTAFNSSMYLALCLHQKISSTCELQDDPIIRGYDSLMDYLFIYFSRCRT